jgi:hypothetical protein
MVLESVKVSHILPNGHIWIQFQSGIMDAILEMKPLVRIETIPRGRIIEKVKQQLESGHLYFVTRFRMDNRFYRSKVLASFDFEDVGEVTNAS